MLCKDKGIEGMSGPVLGDFRAVARPRHLVLPPPTPRPMCLADVAAEISRGNRVLLLMRHAERPHLSLEDPTFGFGLPLTDAGTAAAEAAGKILAPLAGSVQFRSSPMARCRLTAAAVARGMGLPDAEIPADPVLGAGTHYFADAHRVFETIRDRGFWEPMMEYLGTGCCDGFGERDAATDANEAHLLPLFTAKLGIFTSHDSHIAAFLTSRRAGVPYYRAHWIPFLGSAAIIIAPDGARRYSYCEPK